MVHHIFANTGSACAVEADGCYLCGIVGQEEITIHRREQHQQYQGRHTHQQTYREERLDGGSLREKHDTEQEERDGKEQGISGEDTLYTAHDHLLMAHEEGAAHPGDTKDGYHGVHARCKHVALHGLTYISLTHQQYQCGYTHHDDLDGGTHVLRMTVNGRT